MGPNVKFVSAITDAFLNKNIVRGTTDLGPIKMGVNFFFRKKDQTGGGGGGFGKRPYFCPFFDTFPYLKSDEISNS